MSYCVGDKFILEIVDVHNGESSDKKLYRMKGFNSLVFDDNGLRKLEKVEKEIVVGDVIHHKKDDVPVLVTFVSDGLFSGINSDGETYSNIILSDWVKTGKHINIENVLSLVEE